MTLETTLACVLLIALTFYALSGGADFGAGVWHLLARGDSRQDQHRLIGEAIGPIWEANHVSPLLLGIIIGAMTVGNFPIHPEGFFEGHVAPWLHPVPLIMGLFTVVLFAYLAATYFLLETHGKRLQEIFRKRAIIAALAAGLIEELVLILGRSEAPRLWGELTTSLWGGVMELGVGNVGEDNKTDCCSG